MSQIFSLAFTVTTPFWALMIFAPHWKWTKQIIGSPWIVLAPLTIWAIPALPHIGPLWRAVTGPSLQVLTDLVADPAAVTYLWTQIIAWDLFIGRWIYLDSRERNIHPLLMAPILIFTILLSPLGFPLYLLLRPILTRHPQSAESLQTA
ncbi:ABA4-like family protein [Nocardia sp. NPDC051030]|uniref:ABA4-like family protein n=1 Tax=Nocardia sp. NPDC051030 TaxID=3155162 RepID=UPI00343144AE